MFLKNFNVFISGKRFVRIKIITCHIKIPNRNGWFVWSGNKIPKMRIFNQMYFDKCKIMSIYII